jgi:protein CWC15
MIVVTRARAVRTSKKQSVPSSRCLLTFSRDDDEEDETAALMRELEKIKKERAEAKAKEEREREAEEEEQREIDVSRGNPLLNARDFTMKRRWDDDVVFKNQARGTEDRNKKKEFINDMLRSDFHKKFMVRSIHFKALA